MLRMARLSLSLWVLLPLAILLAACSQVRTPIVSSPTGIPATVATTKTAEETPSPLPPTDTPHPTKTPPPTAAFTPTPELLACPDRQPAESSAPVQILFTKQDSVWLWDETSGEKAQVPLPGDADAPVISADGRFIAYTIQGESYDTPDHTVSEIPLWLFDRESGTSFKVATYSTTGVRALHPQAPTIFLMLEWLADTHKLLVQVHPNLEGEGILKPTGDLYLVNADRRSNKFLLQAGSFERTSIRPDGGQIAALDTQTLNEEGTINFDVFQDGQITLIDAQTGSVTLRLPTRLYWNPWAMNGPLYSPDGKYAVWTSEKGISIVDTETGTLQEAELNYSCQPDSCYWADSYSAYWLPDSRSFYTPVTLNNYWDGRSSTTLYQVFVEPEPQVKTVTVIGAHTWSFSFSPDRRYLSYWNQPDPDTLGTGTAQEPANWVTFYLMDLEQLDPKRYTAEFLLRDLGWSPNNQQFIYSFSRVGGANIVSDQMALGNVCQPPRAIALPRNAVFQRARWVDDNQLLIW